MVRWFILGNASNYGPTPVQVVKDGKTTFSFDPPTKADPTFFEHFRLMLTIFKNFRDTQKDVQDKMQLIPSFVDFGLAMDIKTNTGGSGRIDLIEDSAKRDHFFGTMLDPMLDVAREGAFKDVIFAFEVMNEPIWLIVPIAKPVYQDNKFHGSKVDPPSRVHDFLRTALDHIKKAQLPSTVGHRFSDDLISDMPGDCLGTIPQFHYYPRSFGPFRTIPFTDAVSLPAFSKINAILGEFSTRDDQEQGGPWNDCNGTDSTPFGTVHERLVVAEKKGYQLAMPWPNLADDGKDSLKLSPIKQQAIRVFKQTHK